MAKIQQKQHSLKILQKNKINNSIQFNSNIYIPRNIINFSDSTLNQILNKISL